MSTQSKFPHKILCVFGTRPEAIKLAPVVKAFAGLADMDVKICITSQHREMLDQVMDLFSLTADWDLDVMTADQTLADITTRVLERLDHVLAQWQPDWVVVQGDTTTCFAGALAAFYRDIPVVHVEAGLRTGAIRNPWPEEMNRRLTGAIATLHFPPTMSARDNLLAEHIDPASIFVTGNTVVDALMYARDKINDDRVLVKSFEKNFSFPADRRLILVTGHRRENFGDGLRSTCKALAELSKRSDIHIVYAVHLNPRVQGPVIDILGNADNISLIEPQDYFPFVWLMEQADLIITDSGGIQEEAPSLGKPVLVTRHTTERPEAVDAGTVILTGPNQKNIVREASRLLDDAGHYRRMSEAHNPYGDGKAAQRIVSCLNAHITGTSPPAPWRQTTREPQKVEN